MGLVQFVTLCLEIYKANFKIVEKATASKMILHGKEFWLLL